MIRETVRLLLAAAGLLAAAPALAQGAPAIGGDPAALIPQAQMLEVICRIEPARAECRDYMRWRQIAFHVVAFRPHAVATLEKLAGIRPLDGGEPEAVTAIVREIAVRAPGEVAPFRVAALERLAEHYQALGRFADAVALLARADALRKAGAILPGHAANYTGQGVALGAIGDFRQARMRFAAAIALPGLTATERYDVDEAAARLHFAAGRPADAESAILAALARYGRDPAADQGRLLRGRAFHFRLLPALYRAREVHANAGAFAGLLASDTVFPSSRFYEQIDVLAEFMEAYAAATSNVTASTEAAYAQMVAMADAMVRMVDLVENQFSQQGFDPARVVRTRGYAGAAYVSLGEPEKALAQCSRAEAGLKALRLETSPDYVRARICKTQALRDLRRWDDHAGEVAALLGLVPEVVGYSDPLGIEILQIQTVYSLETAYGSQGRDRSDYLGFAVANAGRMEGGIRTYLRALPGEQAQRALFENRQRFRLGVHTFWMGANGFPQRSR